MKSGWGLTTTKRIAPLIQHIRGPPTTSWGFFMSSLTRLVGLVKAQEHLTLSINTILKLACLSIKNFAIIKKMYKIP